jgi:hypothetical protein
MPTAIAVPEFDMSMAAPQFTPDVGAAGQLFLQAANGMANMRARNDDLSLQLFREQSSERRQSMQDFLGFQQEMRAARADEHQRAIDSMKATADMVKMQIQVETSALQIRDIKEQHAQRIKAYALKKEIFPQLALAQGEVETQPGQAYVRLSSMLKDPRFATDADDVTQKLVMETFSAVSKYAPETIGPVPGRTPMARLIADAKSKDVEVQAAAVANLQAHMSQADLDAVIGHELQDDSVLRSAVNAYKKNFGVPPSAEKQAEWTRFEAQDLPELRARAKAKIMEAYDAGDELAANEEAARFDAFVEGRRSKILYGKDNLAREGAIPADAIVDVVSELEAAVKQGGALTAAGIREAAKAEGVTLATDGAGKITGTKKVLTTLEKVEGLDFNIPGTGVSGGAAATAVAPMVIPGVGATLQTVAGLKGLYSTLKQKYHTDELVNAHLKQLKIDAVTLTAALQTGDAAVAREYYLPGKAAFDELAELQKMVPNLFPTKLDFSKATSGVNFSKIDYQIRRMERDAARMKLSAVPPAPASNSTLYSPAPARPGTVPADAVEKSYGGQNYYVKGNNAWDMSGNPVPVDSSK